jgi:spermidine/putrescine-binding protein
MGIPGIGFNSTEAQLAEAGVSRDDARAAVQKLKGQARLFSDQDHARALQAGDVWAVIGSSTDLVPIAERSPSFWLIAPASGTSLWADVWVVPSGAKGGHLMQGPSPLLPAWMEFSTQPNRVGSLNGLR